MDLDQLVAKRWPFERLQRSIVDPLREDPTWEDMWRGPDCGLIACWERGRKMRAADPDLAERVDGGELVRLNYRGGVRKELKAEIVMGTLSYLAQWQGIRSEDLDIAPYEERVMVCSRFNQAVAYSGAASFSNPPEDDADAAAAADFQQLEAYQ
jgi:hypothetical protein